MPLRLKMRDRLDEAIRLAAEVNRQAQLVKITGLGLQPDGCVHLGKAVDWVSRWEYAFMDDKDGQAPKQYITVLYLQDAKPIVDPRAGNVAEIKEYFDEELIPILKDSHELVGIFHEQPDYKKMAGTAEDFIVYSMRRMLDPLATICNWDGQFLRLDPVSGDIV
jgi:hypothetical protein